LRVTTVAVPDVFDAPSSRYAVRVGTDSGTERRESANEIAARIVGLMQGTERGETIGPIIDMLATAPAHWLDEILSTLDLQRLLDKARDQSGGSAHHMKLVDLLAVQRIDQLGIQVRSALLRALQRGPRGPRLDGAARSILLATHGRALTRLKNAVDGAGDEYDLQDLVFRAVGSPQVRDEILAHIATQAAGLSRDEIKILSDVDDTLYANWKDDRYPSKTVYPGVIQLYRELDAGRDQQTGYVGDLVFVTARPSGRGLIERRTHRSLRKRGIDKATVLSGSFRRVLGNAAIASKKLENFLQYAELFPEYDFVFYGDSGQGDVRFGQDMLRAHPARVRAVFIHDVVGTPAPVRDDFARQRIFFFDTYVGAATIACSLGLLSTAALERVIDAARSDFADIPFRDLAMRACREADLETDIAQARAMIARPHAP